MLVLVGALSLSIAGQRAPSGSVAVITYAEPEEASEAFEEPAEEEPPLEPHEALEDPTEEVLDDTWLEPTVVEASPLADVEPTDETWGWRLSPPPPPKKAEPSPTEVAQTAPEPEATQGDSEPLLVEAAPPPYPALARRRGWQGTVLCRIAVGPDGAVAEARLERSSGYSVLDDAALEAVREWRFQPGLRSGKRATIEVLHQVRFQLDA